MRPHSFVSGPDTCALRAAADARKDPRGLGQLYDNTPPSTVGMIKPDSERLNCAPQVVAALSAAIAAHRTPCSNTGMIRTAPSSESQDAPAFVDFLKFTLRGMRKAVERAFVLDARQAPDELRELREALGVVAAGDWDITSTEAHGAQCLLDRLGESVSHPNYEALAQTAVDRGLAVIGRTLLMAHAPALVFGELTGRGRDGYKNHLNIFTHLGQNCGFIAVGGNGDTIHFNLTGQACARIDMAALADALDGVDHKIGRIDAAWDDFTGRYGHPSGAAENYRHGGFTPERGVRSEKVTYYDDMGTGAGCTFQLGDRSSRMLRIYCKGQQQGDKQSPWVRYELQYMGAAFDLTTDNLRNPGMLLLQYPDLDFLPVIADGSAVMRVRRETEISVDKVVNWCRSVAGPVLTLLADSIGCVTTLELVANDKTPRRLRKLANSREELSQNLGDALLDARKHSPIAKTSLYFSAEQRVMQ